MPYDAEVEYLESTGTQYIDTLYNVTSLNLKMESKWAQSAATTTITYYAGQNLDYSNYRMGFYSNASNRYASAYGQRYSASSISIDTNAHVIIYDRNKLYLDGALIINQNATANFHVSNNTMALFTFLNLENGKYQPYTPLMEAKLYYFKIWGDDVLVRYLIPVRVGQVGYMYDRVSGQLFGKQYL